MAVEEGASASNKQFTPPVSMQKQKHGARRGKVFDRV
jgi:hypothetical protein